LATGSDAGTLGLSRLGYLGLTLWLILTGLRLLIAKIDIGTEKTPVPGYPAGHDNSVRAGLFSRL
jgi:hypothetical protein